MKTYVVQVGKKFYDGLEFSSLRTALLFNSKKQAKEEMENFNLTEDMFGGKVVKYKIVPATINLKEE